MKAFTPGPWLIENKTFIYALNKNVENIFYFSVYGGRNDDGNKTSSEEIEANARLIASAPELLEALEELVCVGSEFYDMDCGETGSKAIEKARSAIEKAKSFTTDKTNK